jgi:pimeloyl-ACP methyl ester carboxylesterase
VIVDLVQVNATDGVRLDGALQRPEVSAAPGSLADAIVLIHGTGSNFYASRLLEWLSARFLKSGLAVVRANTRGHDGLSHAITIRGQRRLGAAYETFSECHHDVTAWVEFLVSRGYGRVGLLGHSLGASKSIFTLACYPHPAVSCVAAVSPPRLSHSFFRQSRRSAEFLDTYARAEALVASGEPATLLDVKFPFPHVVSAAGYVDKYGPEESCDFLSYLPDVRCPALFTFGQLELDREVAFQGLPEAIAQSAPAAFERRIVTIPGADHSYTGAYEALGTEIAAWLQDRPGALSDR